MRAGTRPASRLRAPGSLELGGMGCRLRSRSDPWTLRVSRQVGLNEASLVSRGELEGLGRALELILAEVHEVPEGPTPIGHA